MKLLRFHTALALTVASAFVFTACGGDDPVDTGVNPNPDTGVIPFDGGVTDTGNPQPDTGMPGDTGTPVDTGTPDTGVPPDSGVPPLCPDGTEGCACTSTSVNLTTGEVTLPFGRGGGNPGIACEAGLLCVPWDALSGRNFDTNNTNDLTGAVQSCLKPCEVDADCGTGRACQESFFRPESGIEKYCVERRADHGEFCGVNKLTISRLPGVTKQTDDIVGCPEGTVCQIAAFFRDIHPDEGTCVTICDENTPAPGDCPAAVPFCNGHVLSATSTAGTQFFGICQNEKRGPGDPCFEMPDSYSVLAQLCDSSFGMNADCIGGLAEVPNQGGICVQRCNNANPCLPDPSGLPTVCSADEFFNPSNPPVAGEPLNACHVNCTAFPDTCPTTGGPKGVGSWCAELRDQTSGAVDVGLCLARYPNPLSPGSFNGNGDVENPGDNCLGDVDAFSFLRCPGGAHCEPLDAAGTTGGCFFGCDTATSSSGDALCAGFGQVNCIDQLLTNPALASLGFCGEI